MSARSAAKYAVRLLPYAIKQGIERVGHYLLLDNGDGDVGLLNASGGQLNAFYALKRYLKLMADPGADFQPGRLNYTLTGANLTDIHHVLFQRRNGDFLLCIWQGVKSNGANRTIDVEPTRRAVTVNIPAGQASLVKIYEPTFDASTVAATVLQTLINPTAIALSVPDHVIVVEMIQENTPNPNEWPAPLKVTNVTTQSQWNTARANAIAGEHIILDDSIGILPGTWDRSGTSTNPIVIRAANNQSPRLTGPLTVTGNDVRFWGINAEDEQVFLQGTRNRVRRLGFADARKAALGSTAQLVMAGSEQQAEYCTFRNGDFGAIRLTGDARKGKVRHCLFRDYQPATNAVQKALIQIGDDHTNYNDITAVDQHFVEFCYFYGDYPVDEETLLNFDAIDVRLPWTQLADLHLNGTNHLLLRYAHDCRLDRVRMAGDGGAFIWGRDNTLNSVWLEDDVSGFSLGMGDFNSSGGGEPTAGQYPNALRTKLVGCLGNIHIGTGALSNRALLTAIEALADGVLDNPQGGTDEWTITPTPSESIAVPPVFTFASQGVEADL